MRSRFSTPTRSSLALLAATALLSIGPATAGAATIKGVTDTISPDPKEVLDTPAPELSGAQREDLMRRLQDIRDATSSRGGGAARDLDRRSRQTVDAPETEANRIIRNFRNTRAQAVSSTLAEPAAANDGVEVFYSGNIWFSRSVNSGSTWTAEAVPGGPADATIACCDTDVVHHPPTDTTFHIVLYVNNALTHGRVRIFVRRSTIAGGADCTYTIAESSTVLPDYPHLSVSNNFLYLTTNRLNNGTSWLGAQIKRFNASQMANCQAVSTTTLNYVGTDGQRILTPVNGATTTMYFGVNRSSTLFRIIRLPEAAASLTLFDRALSHGSNFVNPDCRGGTGNFDFIERSTSWSIAGFRLRGAVVPGNRMWFVWNVGADASHTQAHIHSAIFSEPGLATLPSPAVFNNTRCFGYPTIGGNAFGEFGITFAHGGRAGGGGLPAQGAIAVDDAGSAGNFFPTLTTTATGTHNRSDSRFGDYFTLRKNDKCVQGWVATNYALSGGNTLPAHVNARYVEFQSSLRAACP